MSFKKLVIGAAAVLSLAACSKSNDHKASGSAAVSAPALDNNGNSVGTYSAGTPFYTFSVASEALTVDGTAVDKSYAFSDATMASQIQTLSAVDQVIQTKESALELWSQGNLILAFDLRNGASTPMLMGSAFQIQSANYVLNASSDQQGQGLSSADLTLNMQDCAVEQKQEQGQDQGKVPAPIDQGKQGQDQGKKTVTADVVGGQGQGQGQDQGKQDQGKAPACHAVALSFHLMEVAQPKQDQGKDQGKQDQGQDQGKVPAPIDQGKQGQDQGKAPAPAPIDQGKQGQDQGKAPAPAPIDQGKQGQDQGKAPAPAPIDQGKQGQDQGKAPAPAPIDQGKQGQDQGKK